MTTILIISIINIIYLIITPGAAQSVYFRQPIIEDQPYYILHSRTGGVLAASPEVTFNDNYDAAETWIFQRADSCNDGFIISNNNLKLSNSGSYISTSLEANNPLELYQRGKNHFILNSDLTKCVVMEGSKLKLKEVNFQECVEFRIVRSKGNETLQVSVDFEKDILNDETLPRENEAPFFSQKTTFIGENPFKVFEQNYDELFTWVGISPEYCNTSEEAYYCKQVSLTPEVTEFQIQADYNVSVSLSVTSELLPVGLVKKEMEAEFGDFAKIRAFGNKVSVKFWMFLQESFPETEEE